MIQSELSHGMRDFTAREFAGEKILWVEKPNGNIPVLMSFGIWLFAIPWTAFALFWESMIAGPLFMELLGYDLGGKVPSTGMKAGMWAMALFGLPFIAVGIGMFLKPFLTYRKYLRMLYVLTDKRLTILQDGRSISIVSVLPSQIVSTSRKEGRDGRGTLILHEGYEKDSDGDRVEKKTELGVINDVRHVEQLVLDVKSSAKI